jgi:hypothetical protein
METEQQVAVVSDAFQGLGYRTRMYGQSHDALGSVRIYKGKFLCAMLQFLGDGNIKIEIESECGDEMESVFKQLGLGKYVGKVVKTISWQGTQWIDGRIHDVHNRLAYIIVAYKQRNGHTLAALGGRGERWKVSLKDSSDDIKKAHELYDWLSAQRPPASARIWTKSKLSALENTIERATNALAWFKANGELT